MTPPGWIPRTTPARRLIGALAASLLLALAAPAPAEAHDQRDAIPRIAVVSAFAPELAILTQELEDSSVQRSTASSSPSARWRDRGSCSS